jgi:hypothetical protein
MKAKDRKNHTHTHKHDTSHVNSVEQHSGVGRDKKGGERTNEMKFPTFSFSLAQYADVAAFFSSGAERLNEAEWSTACTTIQSIDIMGGRDRFKTNRERERREE